MVQKSKVSQLILQLSLIDEVGPASIDHLIQKIGVDRLSDLHQFKTNDLQNLGFTAHKANLILAGLKSDLLLQQEFALIAKFATNWTTILDPDYPVLLRHIQGAPAVLYWNGNLAACSSKTLAIVGSRQATSYAQKVIDQIVPTLVQADYQIVSGGALGVDAMAHRATLLAGGQTVVVVGTGLAHVYPATHRKLYSQIVDQGGAIISAFSMNTTGLPGNFPARNRIISGLSKGCLVVQAAAQSGAKITAQFALEQGRELFVIPGLFGDELSAGCHALAQQGAKVVHQVADIMLELAPEIKLTTYQAVQPSSNLKKVVDLNTQIVDLCKSPISIYDLQEQLALTYHDLESRLFDLQLLGKLKQNFAGLWQIS